MKAELTSAERQLAETLKPVLQAVESHPVFGAVQTEKQLRTFMEHHVFPVWDFMSLLKFLQAELAPATWPWMPRPHGDLVRLVNDIVTGEESDRLPKSHRDNSTHASHFDLYLMAMREVGADTAPITAFLDIVRSQGLEAALNAPMVPEPSRAFMRETFALLKDLYDRATAVVVPVRPVRPAAGFAVIAEAMAMARPVIATRNAALSDFVIDGETGFLVDPGDIIGMRARITELVNDRDLATKMGLAARTRMESKFSLLAWSDRLSAIIQATSTKPH